MPGSVHANAIDKPLRAQYARLLADVVSPDCPMDGEFWTGAWREGVGACIWHVLQKQELRQNVKDGDVSCWVEQPLRGQTAHTLMLRAASAEVLGVLHEAGVKVLMLRGQSLADVLYVPPTLRPQTDIDLLLDEADLPGAARVLGEAGFTSLPNHPMLFARGEVLLDLHVEPLGIERIASWARLTPLRAGDFFRHAQRGTLLGVHAIVPHATVTLPYLCFHAMKHSFERLIWLWDIALLVRQIDGRLDRDDAWREMLAAIRAYRLERPCFYALSYARAHLGAPVPGSLMHALQPRMDWRERSMFRRFMAHGQVPFLAERVFARMQPGLWQRLEFWRETIWPSAEVRQQVEADPGSKGGFIGKRLAQIGRAAWLLLCEMGALFRR